VRPQGDRNAFPVPWHGPVLGTPGRFPDVHDTFASYLREALQPLLPEPYYARIGRRIWVEVSQCYIGRDVELLRAQPSPARTEGDGGGVAVTAPTAARYVIVHVPHDEHVETLVEVYAGQGKDKRLVTSIEVLSLTNKTPGQHGRDLYLRKQREILASQVHLVEIDLLRGGMHTTAVPREHFLAKVGPCDYHACAHRFDNLEDYFVYPIQLAERLPTIEIPLLPGDTPVVVDLQGILNRCYDSGQYQRELRYELQDVVPALRAEQMAWAKGVLQAAPRSA
jgi:Protein of unknown function (DUF4058)